MKKELYHLHLPYFSLSQGTNLSVNASPPQAAVGVDLDFTVQGYKVGLFLFINKGDAQNRLYLSENENGKNFYLCCFS